MHICYENKFVVICDFFNNQNVEFVGPETGFIKFSVMKLSC